LNRRRDPRGLERLLRPATMMLHPGFVAAVVTVGFAGVVSAGSLPSATLESTAPSSGEFAGPPPGAGPLIPADLASLIGPLPGGSQQSIDPLFRADATASSGAAGGAGPFGFLGAAWQSPNLLGDMGGLRPALSKYGVTLSILENVETFGNLTGGVRQGFEADGLTTVTVQVDTAKAFGLNGGLFNVSGLQYWGGDLSADNLLVMQTATDIEAPVGVRLWELWYQQKFGDKFDIKVGEQSLDEEFIISPSSYFFINAASGWPALPSADLPGGGPAYPLAGLGVRGRAQLTDAFTVLAGLFNGSPIPRNSPDTPASNPYGVSFPLNTGLLAIAELQFTFPGSGGSAKGNDQGPLPGTYKIGAWYDSYKFDDQQYDNVGLPLASPMSNGTPATHHGLFSIYGIADQAIWRAKDDSGRTLNVFVRPMFTPYQGRNLIDLSVNAGLSLKGPFPGRDSDSFGVETGVARVANGASRYDQDLNFYDFPNSTPVRSAETFFEVSYQAQILPSLQLQPDVQYFINPGAGIPNPNDPTQKIKNEWVIGLRTNITF
jgi:porin